MSNSHFHIRHKSSHCANEYLFRFLSLRPLRSSLPRRSSRPLPEFLSLRPLWSSRPLRLSVDYLSDFGRPFLFRYGLLRSSLPRHHGLGYCPWGDYFPSVFGADSDFKTDHVVGDWLGGLDERCVLENF